MKNTLILGLTTAMLSGCGGGGNKPAPVRTASLGPVPTATGPINSTCLASDRSARSRHLCGCIQSVANETLTLSEQKRAATFYDDPHRAQIVRRSDRASDEHFWEVYSTYAERAEQVCR